MEDRLVFGRRGLPAAPTIQPAASETLSNQSNSKAFSSNYGHGRAMTIVLKMNQRLKLLVLNVPWFALFCAAIWATRSFSGSFVIVNRIILGTMFLLIILTIFTRNVIAPVGLAMMAAILMFFDFKTTDNVKHLLDHGSYSDGHIQLRSVYILLILVSLTSALINAKSADVKGR